MAAIEQGAPLMTVDYHFWVRLPERQYIRLLSIVQRLNGTIRARTVDEHERSLTEQPRMWNRKRRAISAVTP